MGDVCIKLLKNTGIVTLRAYKAIEPRHIHK